MSSFDIEDYVPRRLPNFCLVDVRCFLCRFAFDENDLIIALCKDGSEDGIMTPQFCFNHMEEIDLDNGIRIHMCGRSSCIDHGQDCYTFHSSCFSIAPNSFSPAFAAATAYNYRPSYDDENKRAKRIRDMATARLPLSIRNYFPAEIVDMIMENLVRELAAATSQELFSSLRSTGQFKSGLDLKKDIYVHYREIEGVSYVQWLLNTNICGKGLLIHKARRDDPVNSLWVAFDQLGVRQVTRKKHPVETSIGAGSLPFWKEIRPDDDEGKTLLCIHDGLKLRTIIHDHGSDPVAWPSLHHGFEAIYTDGSTSDYYGPLMIPLKCQAPSVTGFCAYVSSGYALVDAVIADIHDSPGFSRQVLRTYNTLSYGDWMYMPIDEGEHVEDIWIVKYESWGMALMFVTNLGRASMLGPMGHPGPNRAGSPSFLRIFSRYCGPGSDLYLGDMDYRKHANTIETMGRDKKLKQMPHKDVRRFVQKIKPEWNPYPPALTPAASPWPPFEGLTYFNKARLEGVEYITCCVNQAHVHRPIVGMMLHFRGGRRACLGLYRHDWVQPRLAVAGAESMPLVITTCHDDGEYYDDGDGYGVYVSAVSVGDASVKSSGGTEGKKVRTLRIPWVGWLEWWFSNVTHYNGRSSCHITHVA